jgi:hypothetical protein
VGVGGFIAESSWIVSLDNTLGMHDRREPSIVTISVSHFFSSLHIGLRLGTSVRVRFEDEDSPREIVAQECGYNALMWQHDEICDG